MRPEPGQLLHFSEDPAITRFVPRRAATQQVDATYVWAVDARRCPDYWFPRDCPRAMAWAEPDTDPADAALLGGADRVHVVEYRWLARLSTTRLYGYRLPADGFTPLSPGDSARFGSAAMVNREAVTPLGPAEPVGDLVALHEAAGIELRLTADLWPWWDRVTAGSLGFSGIRLRNAAPRRD